MEIITKSPFQTQNIGRILVEEILKTQYRKKNSFLLALEGDLGGGKTTFLKGFAKGLGVRQKITSPTFLIMKRFPVPGSRFQNFYHFDCYRIKGSGDVLDLGFKDIIAGSENIIAVEWAEKIRKILPKGIFLIKFEFIDKNIRKINLAI